MKIIYSRFLIGLSLIIIGTISCKKDTAESTKVLDTLDQLLNKSYSLLDPGTHKAVNFGISNGVQYPYDRMTLSSGTFFIQKVNEDYLISEGKAGLEKTIQNFIPLELIPRNTSYNDTYFIKFDKNSKLFSYQLMGGANDSKVINFPLLGGYTLVSISAKRLVVKDAFPHAIGLNGKWNGELIFESK